MNHAFRSLSLAVALSGCFAAASDVTFTGAGGMKLNGTLLMPKGGSQKAMAVLLLPGSGPTDRDGNQPPMIVTDVLKQLAERLQKEGIASLRFDKRAAHGYATSWPKDVKAQNIFFGWDRFVGDARAALDYLRSQPGIDPKRVIVCGHSEGSQIALQLGHDLAGRPNCPTGLILMGAPGRDLGVLLREQVGASLKRSKMTDAQMKPYNDYMDAAIKQVKKDATSPKMEQPAGLSALFPPSAMKLLQSYFTTDPLKLAAAYPGPVLIVQGDRDVQVSAQRDTPRLLAELKKRKKGSAEAFIVPGASHNLKLVKDVNTDPAFAGPIVPSALDRIVNWLKHKG